VTPYFLRDLALRHLVGRFEAGDAQIEFVPLDTLPEFALGLAGAEEQDRLGRTNLRNNFVVVMGQMARVFPFARIIGRDHLCLKRALGRRATGATKLLFDKGFYPPRFLPFA
jgi:hypothetical protein